MSDLSIILPHSNLRPLQLSLNDQKRLSMYLRLWPKQMDLHIRSKEKLSGL